MKSVKNKRYLKLRSSNKQHALLLFLLISTLFWFLTKLSKEYETIVLYDVSFENLPSSKLFQNDPETQVALYIKATGFKLLKEKIGGKTLKIGLKNVGLKNGYSYFLATNTKENQVSNQLGNDVRLIGFVKDTLFFELGFNKHKKVPVVADLDLQFNSGYNVSDKIFIHPDSITISGPEIQIEKIHSIKTALYKEEGIFENIFSEIPIVKPVKASKVQYSTDHVQIIADVEKFTEDSFELPFTILGLPENTNITTYPSTVKVVFQVGLSNYKKISSSDFSVVCNFQKSKNNNTKYLVPELEKKSSLVTSIKLIPDHIEYLIRK